MGSFPGGAVVKSLPASAGDAGLIPGSGKAPGEENGNPLQCSCLENPMDREPGGLQSMGSQSQTTTEHNQDAFLMHKILYNHSSHLLLYLYHLLARWPRSSHAHTAHSHVRSWLASIVFCLSAAITAASVPNGHRLDFLEWPWSRPLGAPVSTDEGGVRERPSVVSDSDSQLFGGQREGTPCRLQWCRKAACGADETWARFQKSGRTSDGQEEGMWVTGTGPRPGRQRTRRGGHSQGGRSPCCSGSPWGWPVLEIAGGHRASLFKKKKKYYLAARAQLRHVGSLLFFFSCGIFSCSMWDLVPCKGSHPGSPALGVRS